MISTNNIGLFKFHAHLTVNAGIRFIFCLYKIDGLRTIFDLFECFTEEFAALLYLLNGVVLLIFGHVNSRQNLIFLKSYLFVFHLSLRTFAVSVIDDGNLRHLWIIYLCDLGYWFHIFIATHFFIIFLTLAK